MAIPKAYLANFNTLLKAAKNGDLALVESTDKKTGEPRYLLTAVAWDGKEYVMTPFGHLCNGNPFEEYTDPVAALDQEEAKA